MKRSKYLFELQTPPAAIGPYSQGIAAGSFVFVSGQLPICAATGEMPEDIKAQAEMSLLNVKAVLEAAGSSLDKVVKTTCFLADINDFAANFDLGTSLSDLCHLLLPQDAKGALGHGKGTGGLEGQSSEMFVQNLDDLLLSVTCRIRDQIYADESITARNKTKEIVKALDQEGLFEVKNSVSRIAKILNLSRDVVYLHLRSHRAK